MLLEVIKPFIGLVVSVVVLFWFVRQAMKTTRNKYSNEIADKLQPRRYFYAMLGFLCFTYSILIFSGSAKIPPMIFSTSIACVACWLGVGTGADVEAARGRLKNERMRKHELEQRFNISISYNDVAELNLKKLLEIAEKESGDASIDNINVRVQIIKKDDKWTLTEKL